MMSTRKQSVLAQLAIVALILVTMVIYMPPFIRSFVGDDYIQFDYVKQFWLNPATILGVFNPTAVPWYYRPTQNIWFWLNRLILGWEPFGYYIILLWFHGLVIALMFRVARQFKLGHFAAFCTAVLFAIHSHWVDVITWISSVAIVMGAIFSLLAVSGMLSYLRRPSTRQLALVFFLVIVTLFTHEEALLLAPFLLLLLLAWRWEQKKSEFGGRKARKRRQKGEKNQSLISNPSAMLRISLKSLITKQEIITFGILFIILLVYLIVQFTRPNPTVQISDRTLAEWFAFLRWPEIAEFILVSVFRFTFIFPILNISGFGASLFAVGLLILLGIWFYQGNWVIRLSLLWLVAHLFFIYWALWSQLPNLYAGRHIYQAGIGLALAIGATIDWVTGNWIIGEWQVRGLKLPITQLLIIGLLTAVTLHHIRETKKTQQAWLANVTEEEIAKNQLYELFPHLNQNTHIFSYRFPIAPDFTRSVAQVWYDLPLDRPGGGLKHLTAHGRADPSFIVLDYVDGQVYDLMPDLRQHKETIFLWALGNETPEMDVATGSNGNQLAVIQTPTVGQWTGQTFRVTVPEDSELHTAVLAQPDIAYGLRIGSDVDTAETVFEQPASPPGSEAEWVEVKIPLSDYAGGKIGILLEVTAVGETDAPAYWANPRLVID